MEEIKSFKIGTINWYQNASKELKNHSKEVDKRLYAYEVHNFTMENEDKWRKYENYVERKSEEILEYAKENNRYDLLNFDEKSINNRTYEQIIMGQAISIQSKKTRINRLIAYAKQEELDWFLDNGDLKIEIIKEYINSNKEIPYTKKEIIKKSVDRTYKNVSDLLITNSHRFTHFITLTFAEASNKVLHEKNNENRSEHEVDLMFDYVEADDYELCVKKYTRFVDMLKRANKKKGEDFYYIAVPEHHKNGNIHFHILCNQIPDKSLYKVPRWLDFDYKKMIRRNDYGVKQWKCGKSTIEEIKDSTAMAFYISKYILKSLNELKDTEHITRFKKKRYYASNNLDKPLEEVFKGDVVPILEIESTQYKYVYEKEYMNVFGVKIQDIRYSN